MFSIVQSPLIVSEFVARGERPIFARLEGRSLSLMTMDGFPGFAFGFGPGFFRILEADVGGGGGADILEVRLFVVVERVGDVDFNPTIDVVMREAGGFAAEVEGGDIVVDSTGS